MTCQELIAYLSEYLDHELESELNREAQQHLLTCQNCLIVLNTTQQTIIIGREQRNLAIPQDRRNQLFTKLQKSFQQRGSLP
jgi:GTPase Era involved in 16S rRNA processing